MGGRLESQVCLAGGGSSCVDGWSSDGESPARVLSAGTDSKHIIIQNCSIEEQFNQNVISHESLCRGKGAVAQARIA